jgi:hypothetical protein
MVDIDGALRGALEHLSPEGDARAVVPDWESVGALLAAPRRARRNRIRLTFAAGVALVAVCVPAIALSATVRGWLGIGPQPVYNKAQLVVSAPLPGARVARVWVGPSTDGGECEFVTITPASVVAIDPRTGAMRPPTTQTRGSSACTVGATRVPTNAFTWTIAPVAGDSADPRTTLVRGHLGPTYHPARVVLSWHGGEQRLALSKGYFIGVADTRNPPFNRLPYTIVAYDAAGRATTRSRIPTSFLYTDWKKVEPRLRQYRQQHGCSPLPARLWVCEKR